MQRRVSEERNKMPDCSDRQLASVVSTPGDKWPTEDQDDAWDTNNLQSFQDFQNPCLPMTTGTQFTEQVDPCSPISAKECPTTPMVLEERQVETTVIQPDAPTKACEIIAIPVAVISKPLIPDINNDNNSSHLSENKTYSYKGSKQIGNTRKPKADPLFHLELQKNIKAKLVQIKNEDSAPQDVNSSVAKPTSDISEHLVTDDSQGTSGASLKTFAPGSKLNPGPSQDDQMNCQSGKDKLDGEISDVIKALIAAGYSIKKVSPNQENPSGHKPSGSPPFEKCKSCKFEGRPCELR